MIPAGRQMLTRSAHARQHHRGSGFSCSIAAGALLLALPAPAAPDPALLPWPAEVKQLPGNLRVDKNFSISPMGDCAADAGFFAMEIRSATGWNVPVQMQGASATLVVKRTDWSASMGYTLSVHPDGAVLQAGTSDNLFFGFTTFRQLCPPEVFDRDGKTSTSEWQLPSIEISDAPRFTHRGILVDVSRKFQTVAEMCRVLDAMASCKLNVLHWHLTDDQGWRPEITAYPALTAATKEHYSRDDLRAVVAHASRRGITIIPEIDVPGHSGATVKAYPELGTAGKNGKVHHVLNPASPAVYTFLDTVIGELAAIFPSPVFHIGADEVGMGAWRDNPDCQAMMRAEGMKSPADIQAHFVRKVSGILAKHGKRSGAWDEALHGDSTPKELAIWSWRGTEPGMIAANRGHAVVFCPVSSLYYDRANSRSLGNPKAYSPNTVTLSQSYFFEPAGPLMPAGARGNVLGAQGCVWGEHIRSADHLHRQIMPRAAALAEALWSPRESLDWEKFLARLDIHRLRLDAMGIPYWWEPETIARFIGHWSSTTGMSSTTLPVPEGTITREGLHEVLVHYQSGPGSIRVDGVELLANGQVVASDTHSSIATADQRAPDQYYLLKLQTMQAGTRYTLRIQHEGSHGAAKAVALMLPALPPGTYAPWAGPDSTANRSGRKQPDEK